MFEHPGVTRQVVETNQQRFRATESTKKRKNHQ